MVAHIQQLRWVRCFFSTWSRDEDVRHAIVHLVPQNPRFEVPLDPAPAYAADGLHKRPDALEKIRGRRREQIMDEIAKVMAFH